MVTFCDNEEDFFVFTLNSLLYLKRSLIHESGMHQTVYMPKTMNPARIYQDSKYICFVCFFLKYASS